MQYLLGLGAVLIISGCGVQMGWPDYPATSTSTSTDTSTSTSKRIFLLTTAVDGNFGTPSDADTLCRNDTNKPTSGTYQALISDGTARIAMPNDVDWVLRPDTVYKRVDGTVIGTTTGEAIFSFPLSAAMGTVTDPVWTGLNADWTSSGTDCTKWTSNSGAISGTKGLPNSTADTSITNSTSNCDIALKFYCVEQ